MNCIGPTARSKRWSPSSRPASVSSMREVAPWPVSRGPRIAGCTTPSAVIKRAAEAAVVALDLADRRDQLPGQVAGRVGLAHHGLGPLVRRQGAARHRLHRGGPPGVDQDAESGRVAARVLGHRRRRLDRAGELGHVGDDGVGGGSRREGEHRTSRRARVGAHQPRGGDHRQGGQDGDQAESTEGGSPPQTSARSLSPVSPEVAVFATAPVAAEHATSHCPARSPGVCPSFCRYVSARRDTATASLPRTTPDPPSRIRPRPLGV